MRKAAINPCERKGELVGKLGRDNAFPSGTRRRYGACECASAIRCMAKGGERLRYAMDTLSGVLSQLVNPSLPPENSIPVVPCEERFREHDSEGTELYRNILGANTQFQGCQAVEEYLIEKNLVRPYLHDRERLGLSDLLDKVVPVEEDFSLPNSFESMTSFQNAFAKVDDVGIDENHWRVNKISQNIQFTIANTLSDVAGTSPADFRQSHARTLYEDGLFRKEEGKRAALFLISKGITDEESIKTLLPTIPYQEYKSYEASAYYAIDSSLPPKARIFKEFLACLTPAQKKAVQLLYLKNDEGLSQKQVAKRLGISIDSLADRLSGVKKKLYKKYPALSPLKRYQSARPTQTVGEGILIRRGSEAEMLVVRIDPKTGQRTNLIVPKNSKDRVRYKKGVNHAEIKMRIAFMCPIPYPVG